MKKILQFLRRATAAVTIAYLAFIIILFLLQFVLPIEYGDLTRSLVVVLLFLSLIFLPLCLLFRHWRIALVTVIPVVGFVFVYGPFLIFREPEPLSTGTQITLLTFNLQAATASFESLVSVIEDADADVVGVQELSYEAAAHLRSVLSERYSYLALYPQENSHIGQGVLSRYPITTETFWRNQQFEATLGHLRVELEISGVPIVLYNTHPVPAFAFERGFNGEPHSNEISELLDRAAQESSPVLMVGDFNMTEQYDEYHQITSEAGYIDTFREAGDIGFGFTFPAGNRLPLPPLIRLDYVFHDEHFQGVEARVLQSSTTSDHLPVFARLSLPED